MGREDRLVLTRLLLPLIFFHDLWTLLRWHSQEDERPAAAEGAEEFLRHFMSYLSA